MFKENIASLPSDFNPFNVVTEYMWARTGPRSPIKKNISENGDRENFLTKNFQDTECPNFFVVYVVLQTLRIESMQPIESPSAFWKNTDKVFPTGHREQSIGLLTRSLLKPAVGWTGSGLFSGFKILSTVATYFIFLAV